MKIRSDFVSNSSTTVFTIKLDDKRNVTRERIRSVLAELQSFFEKVMTKATIDPKKYEESLKGWNLDQCPASVEDGYSDEEVNVVVPINYEHAVDYLRPFLVNMFNAQEDEIF